MQFQAASDRRESPRQGIYFGCMVPANTGGFGDALDAARIFAANELEPLQARFLEVNDWLGEEVVRFRPYALATGAAG